MTARPRRADLAHRDLQRLFAELKRRRVLRVAVAYLAAAWAVLAGAATLLQVLTLPPWTGRLVVALLIVGFPVVLVLAWAYDIGPDGVRRTTSVDGRGSVPEPAAGGTSPGRGSRRAADLALGAAAGLLIGVPAALLGAAVLHTLSPRVVPLTFGAGAMAVAASLVVVDFIAGLLILPRTLRARRTRELGFDSTAVARPSRRLGGGLGFALGVLAALTLAYTLAPRQSTGPLFAGPSRELYLESQNQTLRVKVAVMRFRNLSGDPGLEPIGRVAEEWVARRLGSIPEAQVVGTGPFSGGVEDTSAGGIRALARRAGADAVLVGSIYREGDYALLSARLLPSPDGRLPAEMGLQPIGPVRVPLRQASAGAERLAAMVAGAAASACVRPECVPGRRPPTYEALRLWIQGSLAQDSPTGRSYFRRAIAADSTFANAYTLLSLGSSCAVRDSLTAIMEARPADFSEFDLWYMRANQAECRGDVETAYEDWRRGVDAARGFRGPNQGLARLAAATGRLAEAERLFETITLDLGWGYGSYLALTDVVHLRGDYAKEMRVAEEGRRRFSETRFPARPRLGWRALAALGRSAELEGRIAEARRANADLLSLASWYLDAAYELEWHGHAATARQFAERALDELGRAAPTSRASAPHLATRASALAQMGRWPEAARALDSIRVPVRQLIALRGIVAAHGADIAGARAALARIAAMPDSAFIGSPQRELCEAGILAAAGDKEKALQRLTDGQARRTLPRSDPSYAHAQMVLLRDLWHEPRLDRMFAERD